MADALLCHFNKDQMNSTISYSIWDTTTIKKKLLR